MKLKELLNDSVDLVFAGWQYVLSGKPLYYVLAAPPELYEKALNIRQDIQQDVILPIRVEQAALFGFDEEPLIDLASSKQMLLILVRTRGITHIGNFLYDQEKKVLTSK